MKTQQRVWNKSELEQMDEWEENKDGDWVNKQSGYCIHRLVLGLSVQWCKDKCYHVTDEMIATERLDKGEIGITLENGTTLKVGDKVRQSNWDNNQFINITFIGKTFFVGIDNDRYENAYFIHEDWLPYEPKEEPKPLERYQKFYVIYFDKTLMEKYGISKDKIKASSNNIANVYTEQEAIDLGLKI